MAKKGLLGDILSIGSDILGFVPGFQWAPFVGNALGGGINGGWKGALLGEAGTLLGAGIPGLGGAVGAKGFGDLTAEGGLGGILGNVGGNVGAAVGDEIGGGSGSSIGGAVGGGLGRGAGMLGAQAGTDVLAHALGMGNSPTPGAQNTLAAAPLAGKTPSGGAPPAGLGISGSTAPSVYPWRISQPQAAPQTGGQGQNSPLPGTPMGAG